MLFPPISSPSLVVTLQLWAAISVGMSGIDGVVVLTGGFCVVVWQW